jgi:hypothetical protein
MKSKTISSMVSAEVNVNAIEAFCHVVPIDLTSIFKGHSLLPAVIGTSAQTGDWDAIGQTKTVHLSDGSNVREIITKYQKPDYFAYIVSDFSGSLGYLITSATGEWWFETGDSLSNRTVIRWSYTFIPKSLIAVPILWIVNKFLWAGYMRSVMSNLKLQIDSKVVKL